MADSDTPVGMFFELQRETIRETGALLGQTVELASDAGESLPVEHQRELLAETVGLARASTHRSLDTVDSVVAGGAGVGTEGLRETVDEAFDALLVQQTRAFEAFETRSGDIEDEAAASIDEQVERLVAATEEIERQTTDLAERFVEQADDLPAAIDELGQFGDRAGELTDLDAGFEPIEVTSPESR